jgi:hypothetical protein
MELDPGFDAVRRPGRPAAASGGRPRITVCEMSAARFSFNFWINSRFFTTSVSSFVVCASRKSAMACCSVRLGSGTEMVATSEAFTAG